MSQFLRPFAKQFVTYSIGVAVARLAALLLLPLYTRFLAPTDYGALDTLMTMITLLSPILVFGGIDTAVQILFFSADWGTRREQNDLVMSSVVLTTGFAGVCALVGMVFTPMLVQGLFGSQEYVFALRVLWLDLWVSSLLKLFRDNLRLRHQALLFNFLILAQIFLMTGLNIVLVVVQGRGVNGYVTGMFLADLLVTAISGYLVLRHHLQRPTFGPIRPLLRLALPLLPVSAAYWVLNASDRFFLVKLVTLSEVGVYGIAYRLAAGMSVLVLAVQLGWRPFALSIQSKPSASAFYATMPIYYFAVVGWLGLLMSASAPLLLRVFATEAYAGAAALLTPLVLAQVMYGAYYLFSTGLEIRQRTQHLTWTIGIAALMNIGFNILLIPRLGALGASLATVVAYSSATFMVAMVSQRLYPLPYDRRRLGSVLVCLITAFAAITWLSTSSDTSAMIWKGIWVVVSGMLLLSILRPEALLLWRHVTVLLKKTKPTQIWS